MKKVVLAIMVVAIIGTMCFAAISCKDDVSTAVDSAPINMKMDCNYYVGTEGTVDLSTALPGSDYAITATNATLSGSTLTVKGEGDFTLTYKPTDKDAEGIKDGVVTLKMHAVNGVNVTDWAGLVSAIGEAKDVVIQKDLVSEGKDAVEMIDSTIYGNMKNVLVNSIVGGTVKSRGGNAFNVADGAKAVFKDIYFYGYQYEEGAEVILETCEGYGQIVNGISTDNSKRTDITISHCVFENSQKMVYLKGAVDCVVEGTVMRNGADALLAAETCQYDGVNLTVRNSAFANSVVCGIILCGWTEVANEKGYCTLNLEGFVDIYNWKSRDTAKLMPATEGWYVDLVNGIVQDQLGKEEYNHYFSKGSDGTQYVHFGIVILATGSLSSNKATINGAENVGLVLKEIPLPKLAQNIAKTCLLYGIDPQKITIEPTAKLTDNENLADELLHGRQ